MNDEEQILIKINVRHKTSTTIIEIDIKDTVLHLRNKVEKALKIKHEEQRLIFKGHVLKDEEVIEDVNIKNGNTIELFQQISIICPYNRGRTSEGSKEKCGKFSDVSRWFWFNEQIGVRVLWK